jgi:hypothetical protein
MTILYVVIALLVGWFIGFLDSNLRTAQKIKAAELKAETTIRDVEAKLAHAQQNIAPVSQIQQDDPGLLRLKKDGGQFKLELDGVQINTALPTEKRKRLIELVTALRPWLEGGQPQQVAAPMNASRPPVADPAQAVIYSPAQSPVQPLPPIIKKPEPEKNLASLSIVGQIDTVLQARLVDTALAKRGVRLQDSPQGEVEVYVGLDKFNSIDEVPDETIKAAIRAAIAEWEDKFTPGLQK